MQGISFRQRLGQSEYTDNAAEDVDQGEENAYEEEGKDD